MLDTKTLRKAGELLTRRERYSTIVVFTITLFAAAATAVMIGSIMPFLTVLSNPESVETVSYLNKAYNYFSFTDRYDFLLFVGLASFAIILISGAIQMVKNYAVARYASMRVHSISSRLLRNYLAQEYEFFLSRHSGELSKEVFNESGMVVNNFFKPALDLVAAVLTVCAILIMLLTVNAAVTIGAFASLGGIFITTFAISRRYVRRFGQRRAILESRRFRAANEALGGIKDIKISGQERAFQGRFFRPSLDVARVKVLSSVFTIVPQFAIQITVYSGVILFCLLSVDRQSYTTGDGMADILPLVAVFGIAAQRLLPEMQKAYASAVRLQFGFPAVDSVHRDISRRSAQRRPRSKQARIPLERALDYEAVSYRYPESETGGLTDVSIRIQAGEKIGVVGPTGAGKTTLADITLGLLRPNTGRIMVDGHQIDDAALSAWQASVGYVPQDIFLTDASLLENIAFGAAEEEIDEDRALKCGRMAQLDDFVLRDMPQGYHSPIGERGVRLSGGQRQRIGIARALYRDADLIVFDEATSALDNATEREVIAAIEALPGNKTIMMVAHRLSTVHICDRILVLEGGRVAGFGSWEHLVQTCDTFRRLTQSPDANALAENGDTKPQGSVT